ncbi:hypothetical protein K0038_01385 [Pseudomonas syringae]|nr:hypothetical protein [Pseudomonas syringae]
MRFNRLRTSQRVTIQIQPKIDTSDRDGAKHNAALVVILAETQGISPLACFVPRHITVLRSFGLPPSITHTPMTHRRDS